MDSFYDLYLDGTLCDAVLKVQDDDFHVHKIIMSSCSYFRDLFISWSDPHQRVYRVTNISPATMKLVIEFLYTGSFQVTMDNVRDVMIAADQFKITDIKQICSHFLYEHIHPGNCIGIWQFTRIHSSPEVDRKVFCYVMHHFEEVARCQELLEVPVQDLVDILCSDDLNVRSETVVYEVMMAWIAHRPEKRNRHFPNLLTKIRLSLMSDNYIKTHIMPIGLVLENSACRRMVTDAYNVSTYLRCENGRVGYRNPICRPRLPNALLFAIGGNQTNAIEAYDVRVNRWVRVSPSEKTAYRTNYIFLDGSIYYFGCLEEMGNFREVQRFNLVTHAWQQVRTKNFDCNHASVTVLDGFIYVLGGCIGSMHRRSAERYQPQTDRWNIIAPMLEPRAYASCTTLHGKVYVCGGSNSTTVLCTAECYNSESDQWTAIRSMTSHRNRLGVVAYRDLVYAVGGFDSRNCVNSVEVYDPRINRWSNSSPMTEKRSDFGIGVIDDRIFVVGGFNGDDPTDSVEYYDATLDKWQKTVALPTSRVALSCCVVDGLPNMQEYAFDRDSLPLLQLEEG